MSAAPGRPRVLVCCDLGPSLGVGHLMRCLALAEELTGRGLEVVFAADAAAVPFAAEQLHTRGLRSVLPPTEPEPAAYRALVRDLAPALVVVDSYLLPPSVYAAVRETGVPVLALVDGEVAGREADLYLNQNLGGERPPADLPPGAGFLGGLRHCLLRSDVLAARGAGPVPPPRERPRVLAFFGGTDPSAAAPVLTAALAGTGLPFEATVVAARTPVADAVRRVRTGPGQDVTVVPPLARLAAAVQDADVVVSAAGTSVGELLCLGAAAGLVQVADNQEPGYRAVTAAGAAVGLGRPAALEPDGLVRLLSDPDLRDRLRTRARSLVDGQGRRRVADAALSLVRRRAAQPTAHPSERTPWTRRPAVS